MILFDTLPEPRDPETRIVYRATIRRGGEQSRILAHTDHATYLDAIEQLIRILPTGTARTFEQLDVTQTFGAVHRHETYPDAGRVVPLYFWQ